MHFSTENLTKGRRLYREGLGKWADQGIGSKAEGAAVFDRMRDAIRAGKFWKQEQSAELTFSGCVDLYVEPTSNSGRFGLPIRSLL
jgi:hypothetical protein